MKKAERIAEILRAKGIDAKTEMIVKNGTKIPGIVIGEGEIRRVFYPNKMERSDEEIAEKIIELNNEKIRIKKTDITNWENAKKALRVGLERKGDIPADETMKFLDLTAYAYLLMDNGEATARFGMNLIRAWGVTKEEVFEQALINTKNEITTMDLNEFLGIEKNGFGAPVIILTTKTMCKGAAAMMFEEKVQEIAEKWKSDVLIIPSSIHEVLVVNADEVEDLDTLIQSINYSMVAADEILSDHAYKYSYKNMKYEN